MSLKNSINRLRQAIAAELNMMGEGVPSLDPSQNPRPPRNPRDSGGYYVVSPDKQWASPGLVDCDKCRILGPAYVGPMETPSNKRVYGYLLFCSDTNKTVFVPSSMGDAACMPGTGPMRRA
jgi:hypothetical protein